ncbi:hypothetical protein HDV03_005439 [Kappamyces sp. JEL0829]|nr:hypothetical protein HDV03_005439 [Kappamyces sp. JEL0829]
MQSSHRTSDPIPRPQLQFTAIGSATSSTAKPRSRPEHSKSVALAKHRHNVLREPNPVVFHDQDVPIEAVPEGVSKYDVLPPVKSSPILDARQKRLHALKSIKGRWTASKPAKPPRQRESVSKRTVLDLSSSPDPLVQSRYNPKPPARRHERNIFSFSSHPSDPILERCV